MTLNPGGEVNIKTGKMYIWHSSSLSTVVLFKKFKEVFRNRISFHADPVQEPKNVHMDPDPDPDPRR